jgi:predicted SAM-dependent methyltransferase
MNLHLGCGNRFLPGYFHIDLWAYSHVNLVHDVRDLSMFKDNSIEMIYASHIIEHFDRKEAESILQEWCRVLVPNGTLRVATPDFDTLISLYNKGCAFATIVGPLYGRWDTNFGHKTIYTSKSLQALLISSGFDNIIEWDWRTVFTGELQGYDDYSKAYIPHMDFEKGTLISLNVEARKSKHGPS